MSLQAELWRRTDVVIAVAERRAAARVAVCVLVAERGAIRAVRRTHANRVGAAALEVRPARLAGLEALVGAVLSRSADRAGLVDELRTAAADAVRAVRADGRANARHRAAGVVNARRVVTAPVLVAGAVLARLEARRYGFAASAAFARRACLSGAARVGARARGAASRAGRRSAASARRSDRLFTFFIFAPAARAGEQRQNQVPHSATVGRQRAGCNLNGGVA